MPYLVPGRLASSQWFHSCVNPLSYISLSVFLKNPMQDFIWDRFPIKTQYSHQPNLSHHIPSNINNTSNFRFKNIGDLRFESIQFEPHYSGQQRLDIQLEHVTRLDCQQNHLYRKYLYDLCCSLSETCPRVFLEDIRVDEALQLTAKKVIWSNWGFIWCDWEKYFAEQSEVFDMAEGLIWCDWGRKLPVQGNNIFLGTKKIDFILPDYLSNLDENKIFYYTE